MISLLREFPRDCRECTWWNGPRTMGYTALRTWPPELKGEVLSRFGRHPVKPSCDSYRRTWHDFRVFRNHLIEGIRKKAELTVHYLRQGGWDFFAQVFSESHCVGHQCWHLHDQGHPSYDPELARRLGDPMRDVYKEIDLAIGRILAQVGKDTMIIFLASHRMSHGFGGNFLLGTILEKLNYLQTYPDSVPTSQPPGRIRKSKDLLVRSWRKIPARIRAVFEPGLLSLYDLILARVEGGESLPLPTYMREIDFLRSTCFPVPNGNAVSGIRINLAGREPDGMIQPGPEMHEFCAALTRDLLSIIDGKSGTAFIKRITMTSALYNGEYSEHLPDLLIEWNDDSPLGSSAVGDREGSRLTSVFRKIRGG